MNRAAGHDDRDPEDRHFPRLWNWRCGAPHREHPIDSATTPLVARKDYPPGAVEGSVPSVLGRAGGAKAGRCVAAWKVMQGGQEL
jgi:hypothetical protein